MVIIHKLAVGPYHGGDGSDIDSYHGGDGSDIESYHGGDGNIVGPHTMFNWFSTL